MKKRTWAAAAAVVLLACPASAARLRDDPLPRRARPDRHLERDGPRRPRRERQRRGRHRGGRRPRLGRALRAAGHDAGRAAARRPHRQAALRRCADVADPAGRAVRSRTGTATRGHVSRRPRLRPAAARSPRSARDSCSGPRATRCSTSSARRGSRTTASRSTCCAWRPPRSCRSSGTRRWTWPSRLVPGASATGGSRSRSPPPPRSGRSSAARARTPATPSPARSRWQGSVTLDRLTPAIGPARQTRGGAVQVDVRCAAACAPVLRAGASRKTFRVPAGVTRRLTLPARAARVVVTIGDERKALKVGRGR